MENTRGYLNRATDTQFRDGALFVVSRFACMKITKRDTIFLKKSVIHEEEFIYSCYWMCACDCFSIVTQEVVLKNRQGEPTGAHRLREILGDVVVLQYHFIYFLTFKSRREVWKRPSFARHDNHHEERGVQRKSA